MKSQETRDLRLLKRLQMPSAEDFHHYFFNGGVQGRSSENVRGVLYCYVEAFEGREHSRWSFFSNLLNRHWNRLVHKDPVPILQHHQRQNPEAMVDLSCLMFLIKPFQRFGSFFVTQAKSNLNARRLYSAPIDSPPSRKSPYNKHFRHLQNEKI